MNIQFYSFYFCFFLIFVLENNFNEIARKKIAALRQGIITRRGSNKKKEYYVYCIVEDALES